MRVIGGELERKKIEHSIYFTDSGRSSLRLFVRNHDKHLKYLIPDFFCEVIEDTLLREGVVYEFYHVNQDLSVDTTTIKHVQFDVLYVINYFGLSHSLGDLDVGNKFVIEDCVFDYDFENIKKYKKWFGFNSYRKSTHLADGSLVKTNCNIDEVMIQNIDLDFVTLKYQAKNIKYKFIHENLYQEEDYLSMFAGSEKMLDEQNGVFVPSNRSVYELAIYDHGSTRVVRQNNFDTLAMDLFDICVNLRAKNHTFFVIRSDKRDGLRKYLMSQNIFLPIHWPKSTQNNTLYDKLLSIPVFENYTITDMQRVIKAIKEYNEIH